MQPVAPASAADLTLRLWFSIRSMRPCGAGAVGRGSCVAPGFIQAIEAMWPRSLRMRCGFHKRQHLPAKVPPQAWPPCKALGADRRNAPPFEDGHRRQQALLPPYQAPVPEACPLCGMRPVESRGFSLGSCACVSAGGRSSLVRSNRTKCVPYARRCVSITPWSPWRNRPRTGAPGEVPRPLANFTGKKGLDHARGPPAGCRGGTGAGASNGPAAGASARGGGKTARRCRQPPRRGAESP
jgi:hypothetical protein